MISGSNKTESDGAASILIFWVVSANLEVHVVEHISRIADKNLPAVGQLQRVCRTVEDAEAQRRLERLDAAAEGGLGNIAAFCRQGKASGFLKGNHIVKPFYFKIRQHRSVPLPCNNCYAILA